MGASSQSNIINIYFVLAQTDQAKGGASNGVTITANAPDIPSTKQMAEIIKTKGYVINLQEDRQTMTPSPGNFVIQVHNNPDGTMATKETGGSTVSVGDLSNLIRMYHVPKFANIYLASCQAGAGLVNIKGNILAQPVAQQLADSLGKGYRIFASRAETTGYSTIERKMEYANGRTRPAQWLTFVAGRYHAPSEITPVF